MVASHACHPFLKKFPFQNSFQKQSSVGVLMKRCSENIDKLYRRTLMPKCAFHEVAKQLIEPDNRTCYRNLSS